MEKNIRANNDQLKKFFLKIDSYSEMIATGRAPLQIDLIKSKAKHHPDPFTYYEIQLKKCLDKYEPGECFEAINNHYQNNLLSYEFHSQLLRDDFTESEIIACLDPLYDDKPIIKKIIDYKINIIITEFLKVELSKGKQNINNSNSEIFANKNAVDLFEYLAERIEEKSQLADFSYYYRRLYDDGFINKSITPTYYMNWLAENRNIYLDKIKTLSASETIDKRGLYDTAKLLHKI